MKIRNYEIIRTQHFITPAPGYKRPYFGIERGFTTSDWEVTLGNSYIVISRLPPTTQQQHEGGVIHGHEEYDDPDATIDHYAKGNGSGGHTAAASVDFLSRSGHDGVTNVGAGEPDGCNTVISLAERRAPRGRPVSEGTGLRLIDRIRRSILPQAQAGLPDAARERIGQATGGRRRTSDAPSELVRARCYDVAVMCALALSDNMALCFECVVVYMPLRILWSERMRVSMAHVIERRAMNRAIKFLRKEVA